MSAVIVILNKNISSLFVFIRTQNEDVDGTWRANGSSTVVVSFKKCLSETRIGPSVSERKGLNVEHEVGGVTGGDVTECIIALLPAPTGRSPAWLLLLLSMPPYSSFRVSR